ncbi:MAG TPA: alkaline phosphatase family protein [Acidobacteriaceae bacterium]|jgi:predicted AlkP superfamily pyrophosphatase or phosphodiesterase|nr:alkaline phosphatase family protein [Acidobacteriaceae bacterium]
MRRVVGSIAAVFALLLSAGSVGARASAYDGHPKLVVVLVLDQFRGDYLDRYRADFKTPNGFNLFLKKGAYFPECYYEYGNTMTAPGHSTIGTGAYTNGHNVGVNDWWDLSRSTTRMVSSVEDERYPLVGASANAELGASPRNELASTLGDEVVLGTGGKAKLFGVSLKDRAAILTSGHASQGAYWIDHATGDWESSTYWMKELPGWVKAFNSSDEMEQARKEAGVPMGDFYEKVGATPAAVRYELDFAQALVSAEKLGQDDVTDVLTISISSTDILGHAVGPDSPQQRAMIDATDVDLNRFFDFLSTHVEGGLGNVWVAMTGDHGVAPSPAVAAREGMPAGSFESGALDAEVNRELDARLTPGETTRFVLGGDLPYIELDDRAFAAEKMDERAAEQLVAEIVPGAMERMPGNAQAADSHSLQAVTVRHVYTKVQMAAGDLPQTEEGRIILDSYTTNGGWWVYVTPGMYDVPAGHGGKGTSHYTPYSYDRHVPLAFFGSPFVPGTYLEHTEPVDIAATFAALLGVNQPSACVGRVVTQAIRAEDGGAHRPVGR